MNIFINKINNFIKKELKSDFSKNVATIFTGVSISQLIPFLIAPILTRLYTPSQFGILALYSTTAGFFGNIATFHYDSAIMLPVDDKDAINILALSVGLTTMMSIISLIVVIFLNSFLVNLMNNENISFWLYFVPISVFLTGAFRSFSVWATRHKQFRLIALRNITQTTTTAGSKITFAWVNLQNIGLISGTLIGQFIATFMLVYESFKRTIINLKFINLHTIISNAKKYKDFPLFTNWQGFFDVFNETGSRYIISNIFGSMILGWYSFTVGLLQKPLHIIGQSVSNVYYQKSSEINNKNGDLWAFTKKIIIRLSIIGFIIFIPILIFGESIFGFIFGEKWETAGRYAQILAPWLFMKFVLSPITSIPIVKGKQKQFFLISLSYNLLFPAILFLLSYSAKNFDFVLLVCSLFMFFVFTTIIFWFRSILKIKGVD